MIIRSERRCADVRVDVGLLFQRKHAAGRNRLFLINNGFSASSSPSPSIKQKVRTPYVFSKPIKTNKNKTLSYVHTLIRSLFRREKQSSSEVIIHVMGNTTSIHKVGYLISK